MESTKYPFLNQEMKWDLLFIFDTREATGGPTIQVHDTGADVYYDGESIFHGSINKARRVQVEATCFVADMRAAYKKLTIERYREAGLEV